MNRILVPTDFSTPSRTSFSFAMELGEKAHAEVYVVHMMELPFLPETTFGIQPYPLNPDIVQKALSTATKLFEEMKSQVHSDIPVHFRAINDYVVPGLLDFIDKNDIDQVVMSTHGASDMYDFFVGSTAEKVAQLSSAPVISIPQATPLASIKNILFPNTLELDQHDLMTDLQSLQHLLGATLHILLINTPRNFYDEQQARERLERFASHYGLHNFTLNFRSNRIERSGIIEFMNEVKADMIAMATHGRTGLAHILKGSVTEDVLTLIDRPIWTWNLKNTKRPIPDLIEKAQ